MLKFLINCLSRLKVNYKTLTPKPQFLTHGNTGFHTHIHTRTHTRTHTHSDILIVNLLFAVWKSNNWGIEIRDMKIRDLTKVSQVTNPDLINSEQR